MANRAYLFFADSAEPVTCPRSSATARYYDSRWNIPLSWWFFFRPASLVAMTVSFGNSTWQEPRLVEAWPSAKALFYSRLPLLHRVAGEGEAIAMLDRFLGTLVSFADTHLHLDGSAIFQDDEGDFRLISSLLATFDNPHLALAERLTLLDRYTGFVKLNDPSKIEVNLVGYTYG